MEHVKTVVKMEETHKFGYSGKGIRIAILDTGVFLHRDIGDRIAFFQDYVGNKREPYDDNGHGTHISGILCGQKILSNHMPMGMCPEAELFMFKILDASGNGRYRQACCPIFLKQRK